MRLEYFDLLSPAPIYIQKVGGIISPKLKDISSIGGINVYQYYLAILSMDSKTYFSMVNKQEQFELLSDEEKSQINIFDLIGLNKDILNSFQEALNFFIEEDVIYSTEYKCFLVNKNISVKENEQVVEKYVTIGLISKDTYPQVYDVICQRNCIKSNQEEDLSKIKSKKALEIMRKIQKGKSEKAKHSKVDNNMELGNIISAVANKSQSLNMLNIWELTVYQLWDCFSRLSNNSIYDIQSMSVATCGDKDNYFYAKA